MSRIEVAGLDWPLDINCMKRGLMGTFGLVRNNRTRPHHGWDIYARLGTPCYAVADGKVVDVSHTANDGVAGTYGRYIILKLFLPGFKWDIYAFYAHLQRVGVAREQTVRIGEQIGLTGKSGNAFNLTGAINEHLHFEFRRIPYISPVPESDGLDLRFDPAYLYGIVPNNMNMPRECSPSHSYTSLSRANNF